MSRYIKFQNWFSKIFFWFIAIVKCTNDTKKLVAVCASICGCIWADNRDEPVYVHMQIVHVHSRIVHVPAICDCIWGENKDEGPTRQTALQRLHYLHPFFLLYFWFVFPVLSFHFNISKMWHTMKMQHMPVYWYICGCIWGDKRDEGPTRQTAPQRLHYLQSFLLLHFWCVFQVLSFHFNISKMWHTKRRVQHIYQDVFGLIILIGMRDQLGRLLPRDFHSFIFPCYCIYNSASFSSHFVAVW